MESTCMSPAEYEVFRYALKRHPDGLFKTFMQYLDSDVGAPGITDFLIRNPLEDAKEGKISLTPKEERTLLEMPGFFGRRRALKNGIVATVAGVAAVAGSLEYREARGRNNLTPVEDVITQGGVDGGLVSAAVGTHVVLHAAHKETRKRVQQLFPNETEEYFKCLDKNLRAEYKKLSRGEITNSV